MSKSATYASLARSLAAIALAALAGPLPAAASAALSELVKLAIKRLEGDAALAAARRKRIEAVVLTWADAEGLGARQARIGLELAARTIGQFGVSDDEAADLLYSSEAAAERTISRAAAADRAWGKEPHYSVAVTAVRVTYGALFDAIAAGNRVLVSTTGAIRRQLAAQARLAARKASESGAALAEIHSRLERIQESIDRDVAQSSVTAATAELRVADAKAKALATAVPAPNPRFSGRDRVLADLEGGFAPGGPTVQAVVGMGGVGKTQLAAQFVARNAGSYELIWWIESATAEQVAEGFRDLLLTLGVGLEEGTASAELAVKTALALGEVRSWLVVFDNADAPAGVEPWIPRVRSAPGGRGHVLVTTRRGGYSSLGEVRHLDIWSPGEAHAFLLRRLGDVPEEDRDGLAQAMGHLPLALEQASSYMIRTAMACRDYVELFRDRMGEMMSRGSVAGHEAVMATLWDISLQALTVADPAAARLALMCAYLDDSPVPIRLFRQGEGRLPEELRGVFADSLRTNDVVGSLLDYSLCSRVGDSLSFHVLTKAAVRIWDEREFGRPSGLPAVLRVVRRAFPAMTMGKSEEWGNTQDWVDIYPHLVTAGRTYLTGQHADPVLNRLAVDALTSAIVFDGVRGAYPQALLLADFVYSVLNSSPVAGDDRWRAGRALDVARAYVDVGDYSMALPFAEEAVEIMIGEAAGRPDTDLAIDLALVSTIHYELGNYEDAVLLSERALAIARAAGARPRVVARRLSELGLRYLAVDRLAEAESLLGQAAVMARDAVGTEHPEYAGTLANYGSALLARGDVNGARDALFEALEIVERVTGRPDHPMVGRLLIQIMDYYESVGERGRSAEIRSRASDLFGVAEVRSRRPIRPR